MQRCIRHRSPGKPYRTNHSFRGEDTGSAHLNHDVLHNGGLNLRGILVGSRPFGEFRGGAQPFPGGKVVHLNYRAVNIAGKLFPVVVNRCHLGVNFRNPRQLFIWNHFKTKFFQILQGFTMAGEGNALGKLDIENKNIKPAFGRDFRIQLPQGTRSGIPGVGEQRLPLFLPAFIQPMEGLFGHIHLPADNQPGGSVLQGHGNGTDGFDILRHILPDISVPSGCAANQFPVHVFQGNG